MLSLGFVTGVEPDRWLRKYENFTAHGLDARGLRDPVGALLASEVDVALARLPDPRIDDIFHVVRLYKEATGVAVPKDSVLAEYGKTTKEAIPAADLAGEIVNYRLGDDGVVDLAALDAALDVVAANVGVAIAPRPALKLLNRKGVVHLELADPTVPVTTIAVVFRKDRDADDIQDFIGVTRGRTARSTRQTQPAAVKKTRRTPTRDAVKATVRRTGTRGQRRRRGRR